MIITIDQLVQWLNKANGKIQENKSYLTDLDQAIGDGDHGINMARGFQEMAKRVNETEIEDIGHLFQLVGNTLMQKVGGASGPIYGMAFLKGAPPLKGKQTITIDDFIESFQLSVQAIQKIGKAELGYKTLLDVWAPVLSKLEATRGTVNWQEMSLFTMEQVEKTKDIIAKKGRAAYLGERSIGHLDPGSVSSFYLLDALFHTLGDGHDSDE